MYIHMYGEETRLYGIQKKRNHMSGTKAKPVFICNNTLMHKYVGIRTCMHVRLYVCRYV